MEAYISPEPNTHASKSLLPDNLVRDFGPRSAITKQCVTRLFDILRADHPALADWKRRFGGILGADRQRPDKALHTCARKIGVVDLKPDAFLVRPAKLLRVSITGVGKAIPPAGKD